MLLQFTFLYLMFLVLEESQVMHLELS